MKCLKIDSMNREKARDTLWNLPRNQEFLIDTLSDGRKVYIRTDGTKISLVNGKVFRDKDITVHYEGETYGVNYVDDILVDLIKKEVVLSPKEFSVLILAIRESVELKSIRDIFKKYPVLTKMAKKRLPGESIEFLLALAKCLGLQEDINYWGRSKKGKKYEGREKPLNALKDLFAKKMSLYEVLKKHRIIKK